MAETRQPQNGERREALTNYVRDVHEFGDGTKLVVFGEPGADMPSSWRLVGQKQMLVETSFSPQISTWLRERTDNQDIILPQDPMLMVVDLERSVQSTILDPESVVIRHEDIFGDNKPRLESLEGPQIQDGTEMDEGKKRTPDTVHLTQERARAKSAVLTHVQEAILENNAFQLMSQGDQYVYMLKVTPEMAAASHIQGDPDSLDARWNKEDVALLEEGSLLTVVVDAATGEGTFLNGRFGKAKVKNETISTLQVGEKRLGEVVKAAIPNPEQNKLFQYLGKKLVNEGKVLVSSEYYSAGTNGSLETTLQSRIADLPEGLADYLIGTFLSDGNLEGTWLGEQVKKYFSREQPEFSVNAIRSLPEHAIEELLALHRINPELANLRRAIYSIIPKELPTEISNRLKKAGLAHLGSGASERLSTIYVDISDKYARLGWERIKQLVEGIESTELRNRRLNELQMLEKRNRDETTRIREYARASASRTFEEQVIIEGKLHFKVVHNGDAPQVDYNAVYEQAEDPQRTATQQKRQQLREIFRERTGRKEGAEIGITKPYELARDIEQFGLREVLQHIGCEVVDHEHWPSALVALEPKLLNLQPARASLLREAPLVEAVENVEQLRAIMERASISADAQKLIEKQLESEKDPAVFKMYARAAQVLGRVLGQLTHKSSDARPLPEVVADNVRKLTQATVEQPVTIDFYYALCKSGNPLKAGQNAGIDVAELHMVNQLASAAQVASELGVPVKWVIVNEATEAARLLGVDPGHVDYNAGILHDYIQMVGAHGLVDLRSMTEDIVRVMGGDFSELHRESQAQLHQKGLSKHREEAFATGFPPEFLRQHGLTEEEIGLIAQATITDNMELIPQRALELGYNSALYFDSIMNLRGRVPEYAQLTGEPVAPEFDSEGIRATITRKPDKMVLNPWPSFEASTRFATHGIGVTQDGENVGNVFVWEVAANPEMFRAHTVNGQVVGFEYLSTDMVRNQL